jgi:hypothetical protein
VILGARFVSSAGGASEIRCLSKSIVKCGINLNAIAAITNASKVDVVGDRKPLILADELLSA